MFKKEHHKEHLSRGPLYWKLTRMPSDIPGRYNYPFLSANRNINYRKVRISCERARRPSNRQFYRQWEMFPQTSSLSSSTYKKKIHFRKVHWYHILTYSLSIYEQKAASILGSVSAASDTFSGGQSIYWRHYTLNYITKRGGCRRHLTHHNVEPVTSTIYVLNPGWSCLSVESQCAR